MNITCNYNREINADVTVNGGGTAGVFAAKNGTNVKNVDYQELCNALKSINAIVPTN